MAPDSSIDTAQLAHYSDHIRAGNRVATDDFLRKVCSRLEGMAHRMLRRFPNGKSQVATDDVLQNALMRLLHTLQAISPASTRDFANLAAVHIRRELLDLARHFRSRLDRPSGMTGEDDTDTIAALTDPETALTDLDDWAAFHVEVENLPTEEREVVGLMVYHGWKETQIAELLQLSERQVRGQWRSASLKLNEALGGKLPAPE